MMQHLEIIYTVNGKLTKLKTVGYLDYMEDHGEEALANIHQKPVTIHRVTSKGEYHG